MKIRNGFVSNSSSSSFCIIGVTDFRLIRELAKAEKKNFWGTAEVVDLRPGCFHKHSHKFCPECGQPAKVKSIVKAAMEATDYLGYGCEAGEVVSFYGDDEPQYAGVDAEALLENYALPEARVEFAKMVKKQFGIEISTKEIDLHYGESGNG